ALLALGQDVPEKHYYTCTSCGYTMTDIGSLKFCPVCGAPLDKIKMVTGTIPKDLSRSSQGTRRGTRNSLMAPKPPCSPCARTEGST
ncbi:MAG: hypothetical protein FWC45_05040, partial [Treponema sp.]|nr:hypothetical protein [Treponema sp.]